MEHRLDCPPATPAAPPIPAPPPLPAPTPSISGALRVRSLRQDWLCGPSTAESAAQ